MTGVFKRKVAGRFLGRTETYARWLFFGAELLRPGAARTKTAPGRRMHRRGQLPADLSAAALTSDGGVWHGYGVQQSLGVGVRRRAKDRLRVAQLHNLAEVHDGDGVGHVVDHGQVVAHHHVREAVLALELFHEIQDLSLDRNVESGDRLIGHDQAGIERERPGEADPLALTARKLVRVAVGRRSVESYGRKKVVHALFSAAPCRRRAVRRGVHQ